jgi:imidazolonepropionase-like amidohydrolase
VLFSRRAALAAGCWAFASLAVAATHAAQAQERPQAFVGARILPIAGAPIDAGVLVVHRGKIVAVGPASTPIPADAERHDVAGRVLMPGLVDTHSHIGGPWAADGSEPVQPDCRALDAIDVRDAGWQKAQAGGITTANIMPGSGHLLSGQTVYVKLRDGRSIEDVAIRDADGAIAGGIKMANGTNSQKDAPFPGTRGKSAAIVRNRFVAAQEYQRKVAAAGGAADKLPDRDLAKEALVEVLQGKRVVHHHTHRHDDVMTVLRLQREFGFRVVLHHVSEAWKVAPEIAAAKVPCSIILIDSPGGKLEAVDLDWKTGGVLERAGVVTGFHTDDPITDSRLFLRSAAFAVRAGMSREGALAGVTSAGARMLDLQDRIGTLEPGKDADFIVLTGDPLAVATLVQETWVEGVRVFDRADPRDRLWAVGGWGASRPQAFTWCCHDDVEDTE